VYIIGEGGGKRRGAYEQFYQINSFNSRGESNAGRLIWKENWININI
jgi:hypothetical protein